jgi:hypothetical protein
MIRIRRRPCLGGQRLAAGVIAVLAACGVLGAPAAVQARSSAGPTWTKQAPATRPPVLAGAAMAYDVATGTVVLFGGAQGGHSLRDTWTWG